MSHDCNAEQSDDRQRQVRSDEWCRKRTFCQNGEVGADHGANQTARKYPGNRFLAQTCDDELRRREAVELPVGAVIAGDERTKNQQPKATRPRSQGANQHGQHRHEQPDLKRGPAPVAPLRSGHERSRERAAHDISHDRQRSHPRNRGQVETNESIDRNERDVVREKQALADDEQNQVLIEEARARGHECA